MKSLISLILSFLLMISLLGCTRLTTQKEVIPPAGMSPEETVEYYFKQWSNKSSYGMDSVVYSKNRGAEFDLNKLNYVKLLSFVEETDKSKINLSESLYPNPYKVTMVNVKFIVDYKSGGGGGFSNGSYSWQYYLVKDSEKSDWIIVEWGTC